MLNDKLKALKKFSKQAVLNEIFRINDGTLYRIDMMILDSMLGNKTPESIRKTLLLTVTDYNLSYKRIDEFLERLKIKQQLFGNNSNPENLLSLQEVNYSNNS